MWVSIVTSFYSESEWQSSENPAWYSTLSDSDFNLCIFGSDSESFLKFYVEWIIFFCFGNTLIILRFRTIEYFKEAQM